MSRALIVGIDHYSWSPLSGSVNDANAISDVLAKNYNGTRNFHCKVLTSSENTMIKESTLRKNLKSLFASEEDVALFYFSGHGADDKDDGFLVPQDAEKYDMGFRLSELIKMANKATHIKEVLIILDCCYAGHMGNLSFMSEEVAILRKGVSVLASSRLNEYSLEENGQGLFTSIIIDALNGGAADITGLVTSAAIYNYADKLLGPWDQRPVYKTHISELRPIRKAKPKVEFKHLNQLTTIFSAPHIEYRLSREYEETEEDVAVPEKVAILKVLQKLTAAGLVEPVDEEHMYWVAMKSKTCRLTPLGRFYWELAKAGNLY